MEDLYECEEFDYEFFKSLAVKTFAILFSYHSEEKIPKDIIQIILKVNQFANFPVGGISTEYEAAQMVAMEFCNQISDAWVMIDDKYDENYFAVLCENGDAILDANTFDLEPIMKSL